MIRLAREIVTWARLPLPVLVTYIPDDTFYYLQVVRNAHALGKISFDGVEATSGFHYLHFGILYLLEPFLPDTKSFLIGSMVVGGVAYALAVTVLSVWLFRNGHLFGAEIFNLTLLSSSLELEVASGLEIGLLTLSLALFVVVFAHWLDAPPATLGRWALVWLLLCVLCVLARTDSVLVLVPFALIQFMARRKAKWVERTAIAWAIIVAVAVHVALTLLLCGQITQDSGSVKVMLRALALRLGAPSWSLSSFGDLDLVLLARLDLAAKWPWLVPAVVLCTIALVAALPLVRRAMLAPERRLLALAGAGLFGYLILTAAYRWLLIDVQIWYLAVPSVLIAFALAGGLQVWVSVLPRSAAITRIRRWSVVGAALLSIGLAGISSGATPYPWQEAMFEEAVRLRGMRINGDLHGRVGAWNAGILAYFSGVPVVNMDGLVNNGVRRAISLDRPGQVAVELDRQGVRYVFDWEAAYSNWAARFYLGDDFFRRLVTLRQFEHPVYWGTPNFILAEIRR